MISAYLKVGIIGFGGGSALIPVIETEVVRNRGLITQEDYNSHVVVANITPGALPVKLASAGGYHICGIPGMILAAVCVSAPGLAGTVFLVSMLSRMDSSILLHISSVAIGISVFIIFLLTSYIQKISSQAKKAGHLKCALLVMAMVAVLNGGKEFFRLLGLDIRPPLSLSTIEVLILTFFFLFYTCSGFSLPRLVITTGVAGIFLLCAAADTSLTYWGSVLLMLFLILHSLRQEIRQGSGKTASSFGALRKQLLGWLGLFSVFCLPVAFIVPGAGTYLAAGFSSALISFGGGEAYLAVADGIFVSSGMISPEYFYNQLLPVANALPGPILSKLLAGIGYEFGCEITHSAAYGYLAAAAGWAISLIASCGVFFLVFSFYCRLSKFRPFRLLKTWILPVVCGLLISTILKMLSENMSSFQKLGISAPIAFAIMAGIYGLIVLLHKKTKLHDFVLILVCGSLSWIIVQLL